MFSGHADSEEMAGWLKGIEGLKRVVVVHGEPQNNDALAQKLRERLGIEVVVVRKGKTVGRSSVTPSSLSSYDAYSARFSTHPH